MEVGGCKLVAVGCAPRGYVALMDAPDWDLLRQWKLDRLRLSGGIVRACGTGRESGFVVARLLLNAKHNDKVFHRNGNPLDARRENIVAIPRGLLRQAAIEQARKPSCGDTVTLRDGRVRTRRQPMTPSAAERIAQALAG